VEVPRVDVVGGRGDIFLVVVVRVFVLAADARRGIGRCFRSVAHSALLLVPGT
jgi:hypothetical protein